MRISSEAKLKKLKSLIAAFQEHEYLSFNDIKSILKCGKTSAVDYLNQIQAYCELKTKKINGFKYYHAVFKNDLYKYAKLTKHDAALFDTLQTLQYFSNRYSEKEKLYELPNEDEYIRLVDYSKSTFNRNIESLIEKGFIRKDSDTNKILITESENYRISISYSNLKKYTLQLNELIPTDRYFKQLYSIKNKINPYVGDMSDNIFNQNYFGYGKEINLFSETAKRFKKYDDINFPSYAVKITYQNHACEKVVCILYTGFITYVEEKDTIYIVGKEPNNDFYYPIIIADSIIHIEQTCMKNYCYFNEEFTTIFHQMFSISTAQPYNVEVVFENNFDTLNKLKRLSELRKRTSSIICINDKIYYRDTIRGLHDFAVYLRKFGNSCKVIKPYELIEIMGLSIKKTLNEYKVLKEEIQNDESL